MLQEPQPNLPLRAESQKKTGGIMPIAVLWVVIAGVWFVVQFTLSEVLYRASDWVYPNSEVMGDLMMDASDTIAWPAGVLYDRKVAAQVESAYERALADPEIPASVQAKLEEVVKDYGSQFEDYELQFDLNEALIDYPDYDEIDILGTGEEYAIYVGVCLTWAALIGTIGFFCTLASRQGPQAG